MSNKDFVIFRSKKTGKRIKLHPEIEQDMIKDMRKNREYKELMNL